MSTVVEIPTRPDDPTSRAKAVAASLSGRSATMMESSSPKAK
jgi:hypothetical protein